MAWRNQFWNSLRGPDSTTLRRVFESLSNFLDAPTFTNGVYVGDGTLPTVSGDVIVDPPVTLLDPTGIVPNDNDTPDVPTGLALTAGIGSIFATWTANTEADMADGYGTYTLELDTDVAFGSPDETVEVGGSSHVFTGLTTGTTYYVRLLATDAHGNSSANSSGVSATPIEVDTPDIAVDAITANEIAANAVTAIKINADAITAAKLSSVTMEAGKYIRSTNYDGTNFATGDMTVGFNLEATLGQIEAVDMRAIGQFSTAADTEARATLDNDSVEFYTDLANEIAPAEMATSVIGPGAADQPYSHIASPDMGHGKAFLHLISGNYAQTANAAFYAGDGKGATLELADDTFTLVGDPQPNINEVIKTDVFYRETDISAFGNTAYQYITGSELVVFAVEDDILQISFSGSAGNVANAGHIDCEVAESGNLVSGEGTSGIGMRCWGAATSTACTFGGTHLYKVLAADLTPSTGLGTTVDLQFKIRTAASTPTRTFYHPFHGNVVNFGKNFYHGSW